MCQLLVYCPSASNSSFLPTRRTWTWALEIFVSFTPGIGFVHRECWGGTSGEAFASRFLCTYTSDCSCNLGVFFRAQLLHPKIRIFSWCPLRQFCSRALPVRHLPEGGAFWARSESSTGEWVSESSTGWVFWPVPEDAHHGLFSALRQAPALPSPDKVWITAWVQGSPLDM